jgi:hypothetical protein
MRRVGALRVVSAAVVGSWGCGPGLGGNGWLSPVACRMVEAPGVEPGSEDRRHNGSTCVADRFHFAAIRAHRLA